MNWGLSCFLFFKSEFIEITPVERPVIFTENIPDPNWIAGFVAGDVLMLELHNQQLKLDSEYN